jgi:hypothetical protein
MHDGAGFRRVLPGGCDVCVTADAVAHAGPDTGPPANADAGPNADTDTDAGPNADVPVPDACV